MKKFVLFYFLALSLFANEVQNIDDIEKVNFNIKTTEITQIFKDIAKDLVEIKKRQFNILKRLDDVQEKSYHNEQKLKLVELIIDEQKSIIKDLIVELNSLKDKKIKDEPLKEEVKNEIDEVIEKESRENIKSVKEEKLKVINFKPSTFELVSDSEFLNLPNGKVVDSWKEGRKFTAYERVGEFIKVSGYFVHGKWQKNSIELWIDSEKFALKEIKR